MAVGNGKSSVRSVTSSGRTNPVAQCGKVTKHNLPNSRENCKKINIIVPLHLQFQFPM